MTSSIDKVNLRCPLIYPSRDFSVGSYRGGSGAQKNNPASEIISINHQHIYRIWSYESE